MGKLLKTLIVAVILVALPQILSAQIKFSGNADVYDTTNNQKIGSQYIYADINNGVGTMRIGSLTMRAYVYETMRDNKVGLTAFALKLYTSDDKELRIAVTKYDRGGYTMVVFYHDGKLRYDL